MRFLRSTPVLAAVLALPLLAATAAQACNASSAMVTGKFGADGGFEVISATTSDGKAITDLDGAKLATVTGEGKMPLVAANHVDQQIWIIGDVDDDAGTLRVACWTDDAKAAAQCAAGGTACCPEGASVKSAGAGCSSKGAKAATANHAGCSSKGATAASASSSCCSKGAKAASAGSSCSSKGAKAASAGSSCSSKGAKAASAGSSCSSKGAKAASAGSSCSSKGAKAATASSKEACDADCTKPCCAGDGAAAKADVESASGETYQIVYAVSGMTCGGCESKVTKAVKNLEMEGIQSVVVSYQDGKATLDCSGDVCRETIQKAISSTGFEAELIVQKDSTDDESRDA